MPYKDPQEVAKSNARYYQKLKGSGGCASGRSCHAPPLPNKTLCEKHMAQATANALRRHRDNLLFVESLKEGRPCEDCGKVFPTCAMDFDHRDETTKRFDVSMGRNKQKTLEEVAKCDLVCSNCHRVRTKLRTMIRGN